MASPRGKKRPGQDYEDPIDAPIPPGKVDAYRPSEERYARAVVGSSEAKRFWEAKQEFYSMVTKPISASGVRSDATDELIASARSSILVSKAPKVVVGLVGNMGAGKSSTLNSLLGVGDIASIGYGGSCTWVTQHFTHYMEGHSDEPFVAEVRFYSRKEQCSLLGEELASYYRAVNYDDEEEASAEDRVEDTNIRKSVVEMLHALFRDQPECQDTHSVKAFLQTATCEDDNAILEKCYGWIDALALNQSRILKAQTVADLLTDTSRYTGQSSYVEDAASVWPFVKIIHFHFDSALTRHGIDFLDTPGLHDASRIRRMNAARFRRQCTHLCFVAEATRVADDGQFIKEVQASSKIMAEGRLMVAITKSDVIDDDDERMPRRCSTEDKRRITQVQKRAALHKKELEAVDFADDNADQDDTKTQKELNVRRKELDILIKRCEDANRLVRIKLRARQNEETLQESLLDATGYGQPVPIFSIANKPYRQTLHDHWPLKGPGLTAAESGVPALRAHLCQAPNMARLNEAEHNVKKLFKAVLNRYTIFANRSPLERKSAVEEHIKAPIALCPNPINDNYKQLLVTLQQTLIASIRGEESDWIMQAAKLCDQRSAENSSQPHLALMKRQGRRSGRKPVNLSHDLVSLKSPVVEQFFKGSSRLERVFGQTSKNITASLNTLVEDMISSIKGDDNAHLLALQSFFGYLDGEKYRLGDCVKASHARISDRLDLTCAKATTDIDEGYINTAMLPVYDQVKEYKRSGKGTAKVEGQCKPIMKEPKIGWPAHRKLIFKQEVTKPTNGIFAAVYNGVEEDIKALLEEEAKMVINDASQIFNDVWKTFNSTCTAEKDVDPEQKKLCDRLQVTIPEAEAYLESGGLKLASDALGEKFGRGGGRLDKSSPA